VRVYVSKNVIELMNDRDEERVNIHGYLFWNKTQLTYQFCRGICLMLPKTVDIKEAGLCFKMTIYQDVKFQRVVSTKWLIQKNKLNYLHKSAYSSTINVTLVVSEEERQCVPEIL